MKDVLSKIAAAYSSGCEGVVVELGDGVVLGTSGPHLTGGVWEITVVQMRVAAVGGEMELENEWKVRGRSPRSVLVELSTQLEHIQGKVDEVLRMLEGEAAGDE